MKKKKNRKRKKNENLSWKSILFETLHDSIKQKPLTNAIQNVNV